jgi:hypothetical protein
VAAQASQTLSVSPTLFEMQASQGQSWQSEIRVINVNEYDLTVYPQTVNFAPQGEDGRGELIPVIESETDGQTLAEWVTLSADPIVIPRQQTVTVPITITVPDNAAPGGHYAAILIGTKQPSTEAGESQVQTSQFVTSLLFVRVAGEINEAADIRELTTGSYIVQKPEIAIDMRFENNGNVHVQPQGDIKVYNMWGEERGIIPINHQTNFGNVLPLSIRKFSFAWKGDTSLLDIGRYRVVATLGYGTETKKFVTATTYFWVIPYMTLLIVGVSLFLIIRVGMWFVRRYIERMLALSGVPVDGTQPYIPHHARQPEKGTVVISRYQTLAAPVRAGLLDITNSWRSETRLIERMQSACAALLRYRLFLLGLLLAVAVVGLGIYLLKGANAPETNYEVSYQSSGSTMTLSAEDIAYNQLRVGTPVPPANEDQPAVKIVNVSGKTGTAAATRYLLEQAGYTVSTMTTEANRIEDRSVIIYPIAQQDFALALSKTMKGVLMSATTDTSITEVVVMVGEDRVSR